MALLKPLIIFTLFFSLISCGDKKSEEKPTPPPPSTFSSESELERLGQLINLPTEPVWVNWEINKVTQPTDKLDIDDWSIVARMALQEKDLKVLANVQLPAKIVNLPKYAVEPWMEDVIASKFKLDETGEFYRPLGIMLSAEQFYREPLLTGAIYVINETEILLFLQTQ